MPLYAALLLFFFNRTSFPEEASSLPLRETLPKRQLKPQTNKTEKKLNFFKTAVSQRTIILLSLFNLHLFNFTFHQNKPSKCQNNNISSYDNFTFYYSVYICSILPFINVCKYFQLSVLNIKVKSKMCINFIFYFVKLLIRQQFSP